MTPAARFGARVVFVDRQESVVTVDCVTAVAAEFEDGQDIPVGTPFVISAELPESLPWATAATEDVLQRWAGTGDQIVVAVFRHSYGLRVHLADGTNSLNLPLAA